MLDNGTTIDEQDYQRRAAEFEKALKELEEQHRIVAMPTLTFSPYGIVPQLKYVDRDKIEQILQDSQEKAAASQPLTG